MPVHAELQPLSVADYLAGERRSEVRHEYIAGQVYAMVGTSQRHNLIALNLFSALRGPLKDGPCRVFVSDLKVRVEAADAFYYPDLVVTCSDGEPGSHVVADPVLVVEVLSPTTEATDRREKLLNYRSIASLQEYVLVEQERHGVEVYRRRGKAWTKDSYGPGEAVHFGSVEVDVPIDAVYEGVA